MKAWMVVSLAVLAVGCGDPEEDSLRDSRAVADFKREVGLDFLRCPDLVRYWDACTGTDCSCSPAQLDAAQCLMDARASCTAAHLTLRDEIGGTEGRLLTDLLVVPEGQRCSVVQFYDTTNVVDHCHDVSRTTCNSLSLEEGHGACSLLAVGCSDSVYVVSDPGPFCSMEGW